MWNDAVDLRDFYRTSLGQIARRTIRRRIRQTWDNVAGLNVLGFGYATPYLLPFRDEARRVIAESFGPPLPVQNLPTLLDIEFESDVWTKWGAKCLSCGSCAMACPTCYCYGTCERISMDGRSASKIKQLYSCNFIDFARVAGDHNFRPEREVRLKYRYYHQHRGFAETFEEPMCVGCNRCGRVCLSGINPPEIIADLQDEDRP